MKLFRFLLLLLLVVVLAGCSTVQMIDWAVERVERDTATLSGDALLIELNKRYREADEYDKVAIVRRLNREPYPSFSRKNDHYALYSRLLKEKSDYIIYPTVRGMLATRNKTYQKDVLAFVNRIDSDYKRGKFLEILKKHKVLPLRVELEFDPRSHYVDYKDGKQNAYASIATKGVAEHFAGKSNLLVHDAEHGVGTVELVFHDFTAKHSRSKGRDRNCRDEQVWRKDYKGNNILVKEKRCGDWYTVHKASFYLDYLVDVMIYKNDGRLLVKKTIKQSGYDFEQSTSSYLKVNPQAAFSGTIRDLDAELSKFVLANYYKMLN